MSTIRIKRSGSGTVSGTSNVGPGRHGGCEPCCRVVIIALAVVSKSAHAVRFHDSRNRSSNSRSGSDTHHTGNMSRSSPTGTGWSCSLW